MKKNKLIKNIIKLIMSVITIFIILIVLGILPDTLVIFRENLKQVSFLENLFVDIITDEIYVKIILGPLFNCIAIFVSILAFYTAKSNEKNQLIKKNASIIIATTIMQNFIQKNMDTIYRLNTNTGDISELLLNDAIQNAAFLYSAEKISVEQFKLFNQLSKDVYKINKLHSLGKDEEKKEKIKSFCNTYFEDGSLEFDQKLRDLEHTLIDLTNEVK